MSEWSLKALYEGYQDENFLKDFDTLEILTVELELIAKKLTISQEDSTESGLLNILERLEQYKVLQRRLQAFISLNQSVNTTDKDTSIQMTRLQNYAGRIQKPYSTIYKFIGAIPDLNTMIERNEKLKEYAFYLKEIEEECKYLLSDDVEGVIGRLNLSGGAAWEEMRDYLTSTLEVDYKGDKVTLSDIRNLAYSPDANTRKDAYEAELLAYDKIKEAISFSLNNIKLQVNTLCELRGYSSALEMALKDSRMKKETLDAMLEQMKEYLPKFRLYLKKKAEYMGYKNGLPFYELFAPLGSNNRKFDIEQAKEYLLFHFRKFSDDLADMVERAFHESWIDFYPKKGKVGGAFCSNLPFIGQSRILTNFDGCLGDVVTLAHELGHAYHGQQIESHLPLNWGYTMPVAETASTFNENLIMNAAIHEAESSEEKMALIESQLQDTTQIIVDIYSRFLFEAEVFEKGKNGFLFSKELEEIMLWAQKEAYGDGLDSSYLHPYMWVNKGHYYSADLSFYNFPYAFGGLFARGLYAKYEKEGKDFVPLYKKLLHATTVNTVEDVASIAGIDLTKPDFWREGLESFSNLIDQFIELTEQ